MLRRGGPTRWAGDSEAGRSLAAETRKQVDELPDADPDGVTWEHAALDVTVARILAGLGRLPEAAARARAAVTGFQAIGAGDEARYAEDLAAQIATDGQEAEPDPEG